MNVSLRPHFLAWTLVLVAAAGRSVAAEDDVTVVSATSPGSTKATKKSADGDGTPVVHKASHKKKHATQTAAAPPSAPTSTARENGTASGVANAPSSLPAPASARSSAAAGSTYTSSPPQTAALKNGASTTAEASSVVVHQDRASGAAAAVPSVETGLPVAKYPGAGAPIRGVSTYQPVPARTSYYAGALPVALSPLTSSTLTSFTPPPNRPPPEPLSEMNFALTTHRYHNVYPWKTNIITTMFWIGEGSTPLSSTTNIQSSWDENWLSKNHGSDNPNNRNGYASGSHASMLNPFYVALPFNDLALPDKARRWVPASWHRPPKDGKPVSACQHRWVEIKNNRGDICYAQWEDVGPLRYDHAEYVFGTERPTGLGDDHAGLDVSPAVFDYLGLSDRSHYTSWRFVDEEDVHPGQWLKLDEQAVIFTALHQMKSPPAAPPIQRASEPIEDPSDFDAEKSKLGAKKG